MNAASCTYHNVDATTGNCDSCHHHFEIRNPVVPTGMIQQQFEACRTHLVCLQSILGGKDKDIRTGLEQRIEALNQLVQNNPEAQAKVAELGRYSQESVDGLVALGNIYLNALFGSLDKYEFFVQEVNRGGTSQRENVAGCGERKEESEGMEFEFKHQNFEKKG
jgi:hypothetical protein